MDRKKTEGKKQKSDKTKIKIIDRPKDIEWDLMQGKTDDVMTKLRKPRNLLEMESKKRIALTGLLIPRISRSSNNVATPLD